MVLFAVALLALGAVISAWLHGAAHGHGWRWLVAAAGIGVVAGAAADSARCVRRRCAGSAMR